MTQVLRSVHEWREARRSSHTQTHAQTLGFVPTMGALHEGHLSLVERSRAENEATMVSIFVNPTQFDQAHDLANYPRTFEEDLTMLESARVDYLFYPDYKELYRDDYRYKITENEFSKSLCGAHRPGHFDGVLTVVMKLLQIAGADRAYFGEKDYQQLELVRGMAHAFFLQTEIIGCPTVREADGLAMSSRNRLLAEQDRARAAKLVRALTRAGSADEAKHELQAQGFEIDYIEDHGSRRYGAVRLGKVRLIDNVELS